MKVFCWFYCYDNELIIARRPTEEEKARYADWAKEAIIFGTGESIELKYVKNTDIPSEWWTDRKYWTLPGSGNQAIEVSDEEWDMLLALNRQREKEVEAKKRQEKIQGLQEYIAKAEKQKSIPTPEEAKCLRKQWNDLYNEGGEGFVPTFINTEQYTRAKEQLAELLTEENG